jgi:iron-sulfur cluster assembly accessory protein
VVLFYSSRACRCAGFTTDKQIASSMLRLTPLHRALSASVAAHAANVSFTDRAWSRVVAVNAKALPAEQYLRMSIVPGGCRGFSYTFEFDKAERDADDDVSFENTLVGDAAATSTIVIDKESLGKLDGAVIDYHSELKGSAFVVIGNSLVDEACACGSSFSVK